MESNRLRWAAAACLASALLGAALLPSFVFTESLVLQLGIPLVSLALYLFILFTFRDLLMERFGFPLPGWLFAGLVVGHAGLVVSSVLDEVVPGLIPLSIGLVWTSSFIVCVSLVVFGILVLRIGPRFGILGRAWAVFAILEGLLFGTLVFMASAILIAVLADLILGTLFFKAAESRPATRLEPAV